MNCTIGNAKTAAVRFVSTGQEVVESQSNSAMSVIAHFSVPAEQFPLGDVLDVREGLHVRLESMVPTGDAMMPYFWAPTGDADGVERALEQSSLVSAVHVLDTVDTETLFHVQWSNEVDGLVDALDDSHAIILEGRGRGDTWSFRTRFPDHSALSTFYQTCVDEGLTLELHELHGSHGTLAADRFGLTDEQREALQTALEAGYFAVPRQITLVELAQRLGISDTAASQRLRRGLATLVAATLRSDSLHR